MNKRYFLHTASFVAASILLTAGSSIARAAVSDNVEDVEQSGDDVVAEPVRAQEIVVTARRRAENLSDTPSALSVFTSESIDRLGMTTLEDITVRTPGVQFTEQATLIPGRVGTAIRFRGMDTNQAVPSQQVGTIFLDGIYVATGVQSLDLDSLERVEIIKGPQSATFGRSTFGGAINYVMKTPGFTPKGRVSTTLGEDGLYDVALTHEGPLFSDTVAYRMNVRGFGTNGQYRSIADGGRLGQERTLTGSLTLYAEPTPDLRMTVRGFYGEDRDGQNDGIFLGSSLANFGAGPGLANCNTLIPSRVGVVPDYFCGNVNEIVDAAGFSWDQLVGGSTVLTPALIDIFSADTANGRPKVSNVPRRTSMGLNRDQLRLSGSLDYNLSGASGLLENSNISFLAGYNRVAVDYIHDFDHAPAAAWLEQDPAFDEDYTLEIRFSTDEDRRLRFSVGASFLDILHVEGGSGGVLVYDYLAQQGVPTPFGTPTIENPIVVYSADPTRETGSTLGIFGYMGYDFTDDLTLDFEWRWQRDKIAQGDGFEATFKNFLPRATLSYTPSSDSKIWATYSEGNLPGFFNAAIPGLSPSELEDVKAVFGDVGTFNDEERLKNYEIGWRQSLFNRSVNFSLVGYYMKWTNQKTRSGVLVTNDTTGASRVLTLQTNAGNSKLWGVEFETAFQISNQLSATLSANYARSKYIDFTCPFANVVVGNVSGRADCAGKTSPKFPRWSGAFSVNWDDQLNADWDYFIVWDGNYSGKSYNEEANLSYIGNTTRMNLRAGIRSEDVRLELFVTNLLDNDDLLSAARTGDFSTSSLFGFSSNFGLIVTPPEKRQVGLKAVFDF
ncbi:TonB-dependent receptor plug domain-containing protein [uncultured Parasphingorhabdus sp.]|uniref:TonB-dependent receptor n=1 Tax=uncultured Parasphingorhabdus sp. TaxID=2709694 RepID=UPI002AA60277|nr:TonB-dependent receptor plug domain-containing protein [uncultured Parasphingorhabdus sp.]